MNYEPREKEIIKNLLARKKILMRKQDFYHRLFHKYELRTEISRAFLYPSFVLALSFSSIKNT